MRASLAITAAALFLVLMLGEASAGSGSARRVYPRSIAVIGHSGATGWNSDPHQPEADAPQNSWATGTNPAVNSVYRRILTRNAAIRGHNYNVARSGSNVYDLMRQAQAAVAKSPVPGLILVQTVDNDMRCDGTDAQNYRPYGAELARVLAFVGRKAPRAHVFIVSVWASARNYAAVLKQMPAAARADKTGTGLCDLFDASDRVRPSAVSAQEKIIAGYHKQIAKTCARFRTCRYDRGALHRMVIAKGDLTPDGNHLSVRGQRKMAAAAWAALD